MAIAQAKQDAAISILTRRKDVVLGTDQLHPDICDFFRDRHLFRSSEGNVSTADFEGYVAFSRLFAD